jgi:hypothetical protein
MFGCGAKRNVLGAAPSRIFDVGARVNKQLFSCERNNEKRHDTSTIARMIPQQLPACR